MKHITASLLSVLVGATSLFAAPKPNILFILSDDHSVPHVGCYGDANIRRLNLTPHLDQLAAAGMRFDRAYVTAPQCAPSRISIFAGRSPVELGVTRFAQPAGPQVRFFTDELRAHGYWAGLDGRGHHLEGRGREADHVAQALREFGLRGRFNERFDHAVGFRGNFNESIEEFQKRFAEILDKVPQGKPFFLYYGLVQPHRPYRKNLAGIDPATLVLPPDFPDTPEVRADYADYLGEVRDADTRVGRLMEELDKRGLAENTLVIFMGDNGEALLRGKGTLYERGTHVPLLMRWPAKVKPGTHTDALVSGMDLGPTILAAAGVPVPPEMRGMSFLDALLGRPFAGRKHVFAERGWHWGPLTRADGFDLSRAVSGSRYKLIYNALPERPFSPVDMDRVWAGLEKANAAGRLSPLHRRLFFTVPRPIFELYDLEADPFELNNLAGDPKLEPVESALRAELDRWMVREHDYLPLPTDVHGTTVKQ